MKQQKLERISEILSYILHLMGGETFSKTKLVKLVYLLDVIQARRDQSKFSGITYKSYYYGPYSDDIEESLQYLTELGYTHVEHRVSGNGNPYYHIGLERLPSFGTLSDAEKQEIRQLLSPLVSLDLRMLLDIAYDTREYTQAQFGEQIPL